MDYISELEKALQYTFQNKALLQDDITHSFYSDEEKSHEKDYERL